MRKFFVCVAFLGACLSVLAQPSIWQASPLPLVAAVEGQSYRLERFTSFRADAAGLIKALNRTPMEGVGVSGTVLWMPHPSGQLRRFRVVESPIQSPEVESQTGVKTYAGQGVDDPWATARFDLGPNGFFGYVLSPQGDYAIDPAGLGNMLDHIVYFKSWAVRLEGFWCEGPIDLASLLSSGSRDSGEQLRPGPNRKEYRLAIKGTAEYTAFYGGVSGADNGSVTVMNRVNGVYERELAIRMVIVNMVNYTNAATDPYSNGSGSTMLGQNQTTCDADPGNANYDIGHVFSTGGGGIAGLKVVGVTGFKARGVTGLPSPIGDIFAIDYVSHEMGHQYGGFHTFNGTTGSCGGSRTASSAYEPGSGSTIMAYAGICGSEDVQPASDDYFHARSQESIEAWRNDAGSGGSTVPTDNLSPTVEAGLNYTIPRDTPFRLTATASDPNGDALTYCWEQYNLGTPTPTTDESTRPLFRSILPNTSPTRWFPKQATALAGTFDQFEDLPSVDRTMTFRCTVRDNRAGGGNYEWDAMNVTVSGTPFQVTAPNTAVTWAGLSQQTVTWNVGGGSVAPNVRILLSTNGGASYFSGGATVLLASTPNDGSQTITVPNVGTSQARIFVEAVNGIFYDVSNANFTIQPVTTQIVNPSSYTVLNGSETSHNLAAFLQSDDVRHTVQANASQGFTSLVEFDGVSPFTTVSRISFILESATNFPERRRMIHLLNQTNSQWELVSTTAIPLTDGTVQVDITTNASRFVNASTGAVKARVECDFPSASRTLARSFEYFDRAVWEVQQ